MGVRTYLREFGAPWKFKISWERKWKRLGQALCDRVEEADAELILLSMRSAKGRGGD